MAFAALLYFVAPVAFADPFASCREIYAAGAEGHACCSCFFKTGRDQNLWRPAAEQLRSLAAADPDNGWLLFYLGRVEMDGDQGEAGATFAAAAARFAHHGEAAGEVYSLTNLVRVLMRQNRFDEAAARLERAIEVAVAAGSAPLYGEVAVVGAKLEVRRGADLEPLYRRLRRLEADLEPDAPFWVRRDLLGAIATVTYEIGRFEESWNYLERRLEVVRSSGDRYNEAATLGDMLSNLIAERPEPASRTEAAALAAAAHEAAVASGNAFVEAASLRVLALLSDGEAEALGMLRRAVELAEKTGDPALLGRCQGALAVALLADDPATAERLIAASLARLAAAGDERAIAYGWSERLAVRWATWPREEAIADSLQVLDLLESERERQELGPGRAGFFSVWAEAYHALAGRLFAAAEAEGDGEALRLGFEITERLRARLLQDALSAAAAAPSLPAGHPLRAERRRLDEEIVALNRRLLTSAGDGEERHSILAAMEGVELEAAEVDRRIFEANPAYAALSRPEFVALDELEAALAADEALLSFQLAPAENLFGHPAGGAWLVVSTRSGSRFYRLPGGEHLEQRIELFLGLFAAQDGADAVPAVRLHDDLLSDALTDLPEGVGRLLIVPDGLLHLLPFAALRLAPGGEPLAARYELVILPSATLWKRWREASAEAVVPATSALVLADPAWSAATPDPEAERGWDLAGLGPLPHARREGRAVARLLGDRARLRLGAEASERSVKGGELEEAGVVHFAAHAVVDGGFPHRSAIVLAPGAASEDGLLRPSEIVGLDLCGRVVVLAACRSASGEVLRGEGVMSLARAFFQAGAHAVVGSLWPLGDEAASRLFSDLYRYLAAGESVAAALAAAQRDRIAAGAPAADWAGVVVLGDGTAVPFPGGVDGGGPGWLGWSLFGALLFVVLLTVWRRFRHRGA